MNSLHPNVKGLPANGQMALVNDMEMYYAEYGEGEPLVFLHGFTLSSQYWEPFVSDFAEHYRVILVDLRGHGRSTNPSGRFTHRQAALDVFALLDTLRIETFSGIGFNAGGMTLLHMGTQQRSRIQNMVLVATTCYFPEECRAIQRDLTPESRLWNWDLLRQLLTYGDEQIRSLLTQFHSFKDSYDDINFTKPYLSTVGARTLIVHGDRAPFFPVSIPLEMYTAIPQSSLWIIPNGDHVTLLDGIKVEFIQTVLEFLQR